MLDNKEASVIDIPIIQEIAYKTWPETFGSILSKEQIKFMLEMMYSKDALIEQIEVKNHKFILASVDNAFYGYVSYELNYKNFSKTKIHKLYILPTTQGSGIGKYLINEVSKIALANNNSSLLLNVKRDNKAVGFYKKIGFEIISNEDIDIGNGFLLEDYVMEKKL